VSKKNRQHNGQKKKYKRTNNDLQNIHIKLKTGGELRWSGRVSSSCSISDTRRINLVTNPVISHERGNNLRLSEQINLAKDIDNLYMREVDLRFDKLQYTYFRNILKQ
jgi:hypothetical protein